MSLILTPAVAALLAAPAIPPEPLQICSAERGCRVAEAVPVVSLYGRTRYPIVLAHGMAGFARLGSLDYWYDIPRDLASVGAAVYVTQVSAFNASELRGEQLLKQVQTIVALSGAGKVNLIGHSHGAQSVRYVAAVAPTRVASVTSVGGPNQGSEIADAILGLGGRPAAAPVARALAERLGRLVQRIDARHGEVYPQDVVASLRAVSTAGAREFNRHFPAGLPAAPCGEGAAEANGIRYYSWSGVGHLTNLLDVSDGALAVTGLLVAGDNDGLVGRCSSHLGHVIRDNYFMNHLDEINQLYGLVSLFETNPRAVYRQHASRLKQAGL